MRFEIAHCSSVINGELHYVADEYSFAFTPLEQLAEFTTLQLNSLQLSVNEFGRVLYPWGYCPLVRAATTEFTPPPFRAGELYSRHGGDYVPGVTVQVGRRADWLVSRNVKSNWICLGDPEPQGGGVAVEFASSSVAVVAEGGLVALWLKPDRLPEGK